MPFESLCGWRNSLERHKPSAYWTLDKRRGALVAKFVYRDKTEFTELREARLTSPLFQPIPAYHSMTDSRYLGACRLTFKSYLTMPAHLDLHLLVVPLSASQQATTRAQTNARRGFKQQKALQQAPIELKRIMEGKSVRGKQVAAESGEQAAWANHQVELPFNLSENALYMLEFG